MTKIITVHGTNAGNPNDDGEHWWQRNSPFQKRLAQWLNLDGVEIEPFHWDEGPNSELQRRRAGARLSAHLNKLEKAGEDYYLIGHSHGGSVIHHALLKASIRKATLPHLRSWLTIGTPFISIPREGMSRGEGLATRIALICVFYYLTLFRRLNMDTLLWFVIIFSYVLGVILTFSKSRVRLIRTRTFFMSNFLPRWRSLRSRHDEAINALMTVEKIKLRLFHKRLLVDPFQNFLLLVTSFSLALTFVASGKNFSLLCDYVSARLCDSLTRIIEIVDDLAVGLTQDAYASIYAVLLGPASIFAALWCVWLVGYLIGIPVSRFLND